MQTAAQTHGTEAVAEPRLLSTVAEPDGRLAELECDHFSIRGYVALHQKKDPKLCSLQIFCNQQQYDEHNNNSSPLLVAKYKRWNCSNCLDRVKNSGHRTTSETVPMQQDGTNDDCSISIIRTLPYSVGSRRLFSCTRQSSLGNNDADQSNVSKSVQECNSKCSSPSDNKAVTAVNVPATSAENNVPDTFVEKSVLDTKDLQGSPNNLDVQDDILNDGSMDITDLPDDPQMISSKEGNGTQIPCSQKPCEVPTEDENRTVQDVPDVDRNESSVHEPISGQKGSKSSSGQKSNQVRNQGPRRAAPKRNVGSDGKNKKSKSTDLADISDLKFSQRKPKKTRLISEIIKTQKESCADDTEADHAKTGDICESVKSKMPLEAGKDNDNTVSNQKVCEIQSTAVKNKAALGGVENVDDGSSLMNWLKTTRKKVRTEKRDSGHKNFGSSAVSNSNPDIPASSDMCHDSVPSVGDLGQENVLSTTSAKHRSENTQNKNMEQNKQKVDDLCRNESENLKRMFLSNGKSPILLRRKVLSPAISCDKNAENSTIKRSMLRTDDLCQVESEGTVQRCLTKVSLGKGKIQNVSGPHKQNIPKNKKKHRLDVHEKQTVIDDIPMDIVELLARNQHERQLMTDTDSTLPKIAGVDCAEIADKDGPTDASVALGTNFQKPSASESKQKSLQGRASSSTEAANVLLQDLHRQKSSQCHAASSTEIPNSHRSELHMQNSLQDPALPITGSFSVYPPELRMPDILECAQEQQTDICRDEEVTIACTSPIFSHHQHIAEIPTQSWSRKGEKKLMWDSFKTASRNSPASTYGFQFRNRIREVDSIPIPAYGASNDYATHQPVIAAVDQYTKETLNQVQLRSAPSTSLTMDVGRPYDHRIAGHSGLYPKEPMPATHLLRLMDSSTSQGFTNYQRANRRQIELGTQNLSSQYPQHNHYNASPCTSHGSHLSEKVLLTLQDLARHQVEKNLHRPLRPHPRVGVLGSLLQQDIANWSESRGTQLGHRLGVSKGTTSFDMNRTGNYETLNSGMFSAGWNALQLGSVTSAANPEHPLPRYGVSQSFAGGTGKTPLDKLVRKDICQTNRNPADFTVISDKNEYMINL